MTRDEAIKALWVPEPPQSWAVGRGDAADIVDRLVALGVLKIDEPKEPWAAFLDAFCEKGAYEGDDTNPLNIVHDIKVAIQKAGLKIVGN